jgi:hypothetical protein
MEAFDQRTSTWSEIGNFCSTMETTTTLNRVVDVYVDERQLVFTKLPTRDFYSILNSGHAMVMGHDVSGSFCSYRGATMKPLLLTMGARTRSLGTVVGSRIVKEFLRDSPVLRARD